MGFRKSDLTPEMLKRMDAAEAKYYAQGGLESRIRYQIETPWVDRKLAGRINKLEREEQGQFASWLNRNGWLNGYVWHGTHKATTCHAGVPDFLVPVNGNWLAIEFKSPGGTLSIPQQNFELVLNQQKHELHIVHTALQAEELVKQTAKEK